MSVEPSFAHAAVTDELRELILGGELSPGERLVESDLCVRLGASRGAVRAAIVDLGHEGLIERIANRGARVRVVKLEEAIQLTEICQALEAMCARMATENATDRDLAELRALGAELEASVAADDPMGTQLLNQELHRRVIELAARPIVADTLGRLRARNARHQYRLAYRPSRTRAALAEHLALIDAVCSRDAEAAESAMRAHLGEVLLALRASADVPGPLLGSL